MENLLHPVHVEPMSGVNEMSELKQCPKCTSCTSGSSKTKIVYTNEGAAFICLWCKEITPVDEGHISNAVLNRIKADVYYSVGYMLRYQYEGPYDRESIEKFFDDHADRLVKGEV